MIQTLNEVSLKSNSFATFNIPRGLYRGFLLLIQGTNKAYSNGVAGFINSNVDVGNVKIKLNGETVVDASWTMLMAMNKRIFGAPLNIGVSGTGAFQLAVYIPATMNEAALPNSWWCGFDGAIQILWTNGTAFANSTVNAAEISLGVYPDDSSDPAVFVPQIVEVTDAIPASALTQLTVMQMPNITDVFIYPLNGATPYNEPSGAAGATPGYNYANVISRVWMQKGSGQPLEAPMLAAQAYGNIFDAIELAQLLTDDTAAATPTIIHLIPGGRRTIESFLSNDFRLKITSSAIGNLKTLYCGARLLGDNSIASREYGRATVNQVVNRMSGSEAAKFVKASGVARGAKSSAISEAVKVAVSK
jgi:hypothetical protein